MLPGLGSSHHEEDWLFRHFLAAGGRDLANHCRLSIPQSPQSPQCLNSEIFAERILDKSESDSDPSSFHRYFLTQAHFLRKCSG